MDKEVQVKKSEYNGLVPAVDQAARILLCLTKNPSQKINLTEICKNVGIHKSKGYSILNTLQKYGFVQKDPAGKTYSLGLGLISLSRRVLDSLNYSEIAGPFLETLAEKTRSTALFGIINEENIFVVARQEADKDISVTIRLGYRFNITHGAHGKAIVAFLPEEERERILKQDKLFFHGDSSKLDRIRLETELMQCRQTGFAFDMGELNAGINVIAAPVFDSQERLIGSMFIMGTFPESRIEEYGAIVAEHAGKFSAMLGGRH
ncbi:MAG: IclR family transcriptional regulator [Proteobacteria bacterium]|nr:IclR family transcriptional regulator [Pseudomonadota bacterium]